MNAIYSINAKLGGGGIGYIAFNAVAGIYRAGILSRVFASSNAQTAIPRTCVRDWGVLGRALKYSGAKEPSGLIDYFDNLLFDAWVVVQLPAATVLHGWNGMCLRSLRRAKRKGMLTIVECASSHPDTQLRLLRDEYARWNISRRLPMWSYRQLVREINEVDYVTVPSAFVRQSMIAAGVPEDKLVEIPFGVDLNRFRPPATRGPHPFRAIFAGQVSIRKGIPYLLEAWQRLRWRDAELWIAGGIAPDFGAIRERWRGLTGVTFLGHTRALRFLYQQSDVFVFPSIEEGSALVTYEAMACGLPIITTFNAGSVARDGEDGLIVPIRDVGALCAALERLRADTMLRERMGRAARARAEEFSWTRYQTELVASYRRIER